MAKKPVNHGEQWLDGLDSLTIELENGLTVTMDADAELAIPDDLDEIRRASRTAPSRYAFWSYQTERALARVRQVEVKLGELEGKEYKFRGNRLRGDNAYVGEASIKARVDCDDAVVQLRAGLNDLRFVYGTLRSVRDAVANRTEILIRLLGQAKPPPPSKP